MLNLKMKKPAAASKKGTNPFTKELRSVSRAFRSAIPRELSAWFFVWVLLCLANLRISDPLKGLCTIFAFVC